MTVRPEIRLSHLSPKAFSIGPRIPASVACGGWLAPGCGHSELLSSALAFHWHCFTFSGAGSEAEAASATRKSRRSGRRTPVRFASACQRRTLLHSTRTPLRGLRCPFTLAHSEWHSLAAACRRHGQWALAISESAPGQGPTGGASPSTDGGAWNACVARHSTHPAPLSCRRAPFASLLQKHAHAHAHARALTRSTYA